MPWTRDTTHVLVIAALCVCARAADAQRDLPTVELKRGLVITHSVRIAARTYRLDAPASPDSAAVIVRGDDIVIDFAGASLVGLDPAADPDRAAGVGIRVDGGRNITIRNARIRGYKIGLLARGTHDLTLEHNDLSYNWKPRLFSLLAHESLVDWLSHHHNEADEWLRFGAGVYLSDVHGGALRDNRIEQGMEGLMLVRTDRLRIWNNVIEFNSGVGIGLYRSSNNVIMHNRASYNVRGYSHGYYRRGQDSADLLLYEQSSNNVVAYNSMTHGGDGLFLWAGQSTMDSGQGGSNDNLFYENDFSFAPTNGMEATFSRNAFVNNRVEGSDNGLWGGYSYDSRIAGNTFVRNRTGIAIEHGQSNTITDNRFAGDTVAVYLWANPIEPSDWGYPKHRDTKSRDYLIARNEFTRNRVGLRLSNTSLTTADNRFDHVDSGIVRRDSVDLREERSVPVTPVSTSAPTPIAAAMDARATDSLATRDRSAIIVDEWGPYDWRSPKLWPVDTARRGRIRLRVLGPNGSWRVVSRRGISAVSAERGRVGDTLVVTLSPGAERDWRIALEYRGAAVVSPRGATTAAGAPYEFSYSRFEPVTAWDVRFFTWDAATDPRTNPDALAAIERGAPIATDRPDRLDYFWYRPTVPGVPQDKWASVATATISLAAGTYSVRTISDDAVRVWIDGRLAIDNWKPHESEVNYAPISAGRHEVRVAYYQVDGWTELRLDVVRGSARSAGSPGPH